MDNNLISSNLEEAKVANLRLRGDDSEVRPYEFVIQQDGNVVSERI